MGMPIDEAVPIIHDMYNYYSDEMVEPYVGFDADDKQAIETALDTMRKYQKIREIAFPLQFCSTDKLNHEAIMKICEVLEDGNDD